MKQKIYKLLSIVLTVLLVVSCCTVAFTASAEITPAGPVFYVSPSGSDTNDGLTPETPVSTIGTAVSKAVAYDGDADGTADFGAGTTVFVKLIKTLDTDGSTELKHTWGVLPAHTFKLSLSSYTDRATIDMTSGISLKNDTDFENLGLAFPSGKYPNFNLACHDVSFGTNMAYSNTGYVQFMNAWSSTPGENINYYFASLPTYLCFGGNWSTPIFNNISTVLDKGFSGTICLGDRCNASNLTTFSKNLNFDIKDATSFTLKNYSDSSNLSFTSGFAAQVINSTGNAALVDNVKTYLDSKTTTPEEGEEATPVKYFILQNNAGVLKNALSFTDTAGLFNVASGYGVVATKVVEEGETAAVVTSGATEGSQDVVLDLTTSGAGVYNLEITKNPETKVLYVDSTNGTQYGDGSQALPLDTIANAVAYAQKVNLVEKCDSLNVKTVGTTATLGTVPAHEFKLILESAASATKTSIGGSAEVTLSGPTVYRNITVNCGSAQFNANYKDLTVESDASISCGLLVGAINNSTANNANFVFKGSIPTFRTGGQAYKTVKYNGDVNITFAGNYDRTVVLGSHQGNNGNGQHATTFNKNVNINVESAKSFTLTSQTATEKVIYSANTAIQIINSSGLSNEANITKLAAIVRSASDTTAVPYYIINNPLAKDAVLFTETAGQFVINLDNEMYSDISLEAADGTVIPIEDGIVTLPAVGEYTLNATKNSNLNTTYYVSALGSNDNDGKTENTPFLTVNAAIKAANYAGYAETDNVYVKLIAVSGSNASWGASTLTAHTFTLNIASASTKTTLGDGAATTFSGPVAFENVSLKWGGNCNVNFKGNDVTFGKNVDFPDKVFNYYSALNGTYNSDIHYTVSSSLDKNMWLGGDWSYPIYNADIYLTVDSGASSGALLGTNNGNALAHAARFNKNVNINLKDASAFSVSTCTVNQRAVFGEKTAVQIINSSDLATDSWVTALTNTANAIPSKYFIVNNDYANKDAIEFTGEAGKFKINLNTDVYTNIKLVKADDSSVEALLDDTGHITITESGVYNLSAVKPSNLSVTYYVSANGSDDNNGKTLATAFATVKKAVAAANYAGYAASDTVYVKADGTISWGSTAAYDFVLNVQSNDTANIASVNMSKLTGEVVLDNIKSTGSDLLLAGHNLTLGAGVTMSNFKEIELSNQSITNANEQTVIINNALNGSIRLSCEDYSGITWQKDVNIIVNNANAKVTFNNVGYYGGTNNFNGVVNFIIKDAASVTFGAASGTSAGTWTSNFNGNVNVLLPGDVTLSDASKTNVMAYSKADTYFITDNTASGAVNRLDVTDTAGLFTADIDTEFFADVVATSADGATVVPLTDGAFTLTAGEYNITATKKQNLSATYYVGANGSDSNDGMSADTAFLTIKAAVNAANIKGYAETDNVYVRVLNQGTVAWGTTLMPAHSFTLNILSDSETAIIGDAGIAFNGDTYLENIGISCNDYGTCFNLNGKNVSFGTGVSIWGSYDFYLGHTSDTYADDVNVYLGSAVDSSKALTFGGNYKNPKFNGDINITVNNSGTNKFAIGGGASDPNQHAHYPDINKNVNFNIKNAGAFSILNNVKHDISASSAIQIINSSNLDISASVDIIATFSNVDGGAVPYYVLTNKTGRVDLLNTTATAGTYTVTGLEEGESVKVYNKEGTFVKETGNGALTLDAGEYTVTIYREPKTYNYEATSAATSIADFVQAAIDAGAIEGDTVIITASGTEEIPYGIPVDYLFDLEIVSSQETKPIIACYGDGNTSQLRGNTKIDGVTIKGPGGYSPLFFGGHDVEATANSSFTNCYYLALPASGNWPSHTSQNVSLATGTGKIYLAGEYAYAKYSGDINLTITNPNYNPIINLAKFRYGTYDGRVNINIGSSNVTFAKESDANYIPAFNGGLNIISEKPLNATSITLLSNSAKLTGDVYTIDNRTGIAGVLGFGEQSGEFTVASDEKVRVMKIGAKGYVDAAANKVDVTALGVGNYFAGIAHNYTGTESNYAEYIDYRDTLIGNKALNNFAAKVNNGEDVNVVYYGGSVTAGAGAASTDCWRSIIGNWLALNAPNAQVNNINSAIGDTGSWFGVHRLKNAVLDQNPDLLFIEFSINDFYNNLSYEKAAQYFESIINWVRAAAPDCDIVVLHTTEKFKIQDLIDSDKLHSQAQAHFDIAAAYGIPTIRLGHALADQLQADATAAGNTWSEHWATYFDNSDIVHPNKNGYAIYANVIKEFLANSILGESAEADTVHNHTLPERIISNTLLVDGTAKGNITFIPADAALSEQSWSLGGDQFETSNGGNLTHFNTYFNMSDTSKKIIFNFTGTELLVLDEKYATNFKGVNVSIDGGETKYVPFNSVFPTVLATGLQNKQHTATVSIAEGSGSGEWLYGFYVRNANTEMKKPSADNLDAPYYVSASGSDETGDGTEANPFNTIQKAIAEAKADGFGDNDVVYVKAIGAINWDANLAYNFNLKISSADVENKATLSVSNTRGTQTGLAGDYELDDIILTNSSIGAMGHNVTLGSGLEATALKRIDLALQNTNVNKKLTLNVNYPANGLEIVMGQETQHNLTFSDDVNVFVNNANASVTFRFKAYWGGDAKFNGNTNFIINAASSVAFSPTSGLTGANATQESSGIANGAVHVLMPSTTAVTGKSYITSWTNNCYYVTDNLGDDADVMFVNGEVGRFDIVKLTDEEIDFIMIDSNSNKSIIHNLNMTLEPGDYTISASAPAKETSYVVSTTGTLNTIDAAIQKANADGYAVGDTVTLKISGEASVPFGVTNLTTHGFKLVITTNDGEAKRSVGNTSTVHFGGDVEFNNINIATSSSSGGWPTLGANGHSVYFGEGVSLSSYTLDIVLGRNSSNSYADNDVNLYIASALVASASHKAIRFGNIYTGSTFNGDINTTVDAANYNAVFQLGNQYEYGAHYNGNLNFNVKNAASFSIVASYKDSTALYDISDNTSIQIVNSSACAIDANNGDLEKLTNKSGNKVPVYVITNKTGVADAVAFTEDAGIYHIDIGEKKYEGYVPFFTNIKTGEVTTVKGSLVSLPEGEYTLDMRRDAVSYSFNVEAGTSIGEAVQNAIDAGAGYGDNVTLNVMAETNFGTMPNYNFNLVIQAANKVKLTVDTSLIANNAGMTTEFRNVELYKEANYTVYALAHSNAIFDKNVTFTGGDHNTLAFGYSQAPGPLTIGHSQTVEINCPTPTYVSMSSWLYGKTVYEDDVNLIINNKNASTEILFNAYYKSISNYTTEYNGNVNINIKDANSIVLDQTFDNEFPIDATTEQRATGVSFGSNTKLQVMVDSDTSFDYSTIQAIVDADSYIDLSNVLIVVDDTFQRHCVDYTDTFGTFAITNPYEVTATRTEQCLSADGVEQKTVKTSDGTLVLDISDNYCDTWVLTTKEYFEDFEDTTVADLSQDWSFTSDHSVVTTPTEITEDGRLKIVCWNNVREINSPNLNKHLQAKDQYFSADVQGESFGLYNGFALLGRAEGIRGYELRITGSNVILVKYDGSSKNSSGYFVSNTSGIEYEGLLEYRPGGNNEISFYATHTYRLSLGITTEYDESGNEVALIRGIVLDVTANKLIFDETFRDNEPYTGTGVAMYSPHGGCTPYVDNVYFSTEGFKESDDGWCEKDINGDGVLDIRDLVITGNNLDNADVSQTVLYKADRDLSGTINDPDVATIRSEILQNLELEYDVEFNYTGNADVAVEAETTKQNILGSESVFSYNWSGTPGQSTPDPSYSITTNVRDGEAEGGYRLFTTEYKNHLNGAYGEAMYVSSTGTGNGVTEETPLSFETFREYLEKGWVAEGTVVLFKRGDVFRVATEDLVSDTQSNNPELNAYAYMIMPTNTIFGAYGEGEKPKFTASQYEYADESQVTWTEVGGKNSNVWVIDAPEFILDKSKNYRSDLGPNKDNAPTNIIFDGGDKVGVRKGFPVGLNPASEKLYTLYKEGDFTYDEENEKLYLYSESNPGEKYNSIEISRGIVCISLKISTNGFIVDNLNMQGFGKFAVHGTFGNNDLQVTNCIIGFSGGVANNKTADKFSRYGNAIELWCGGQDYKVSCNWIYQTFDSAITTQGSTCVSHDHMQIKGNLLEYNNCDLEFFDSDSTNKNATREDSEWTNNIMRFTTLGWGSRDISKIRNIHGVIRGSVNDASVVSIDWVYNVIDTPGKEIARFNNLTTYENTTDADGNYARGKYTGIFKFGQSFNSNYVSELGDNVYYLNPYVRTRSLILWEYRTALPEYDSSGNVVNAENTQHQGANAADFYDAITILDNPSLANEGHAPSRFYFLGQEVTSGN